MSVKTVTIVCVCLSVFAFPVSAEEQTEDSGFVSACCVLGRYESATGLLFFRQRNEGGPTQISGVIANVTEGKHGWHVHELPIANDENHCLRAGSHFNPYDKNHGGPDAEERHVGDLGNFKANEYGMGVVNIQDSFVSLVGPAELSVLGRTMVIHAGEDDLGLGGNPESLKTGNAGARIGCCQITAYEIE